MYCLFIRLLFIWYEMIHVVLAEKEVLWSAHSFVSVLSRQTVLCSELAFHRMKCSGTKLACAYQKRESPQVFFH